jgi:aspartate/methionine/tyrosine aminotransferase
MVDIEPFELERWDAKWELEVASDFGQSSAPASYLDELLELLSESERRAFLGLPLGYGPSLGERRLRIILGRKYAIDPDRVIVTCGATEALWLTFGALARNGGNIVVADPCYQSHKSVPRNLGLEVRTWAFERELTAPPSLDQLPALMDRETVGVVVNFPNNPTGISVTTAWMRTLIGICEERDAILVSDEVFLPATYKAEYLRPGAASLSKKCISIGDMSKAFGMGGLRVGWIAGRDEELLARILELRDYSSISPPTLSQIVAAVALEHEPHFVDKKVRIGAENQKYLRAQLGEMERVLHVPEADGGFVLFPRLAIPDTKPLCEQLAEEFSINVLPGSCFGFPDRIRIHFGLEERTAKGMIDSLKYALELALNAEPAVRE